MYVFAFRSRTQSMKLYDILHEHGVECDIVNTPREVSASCGLSVRVADENRDRAVSLFDYYRPDTLIGIFYYDYISGYRRYR